MIVPTGSCLHHAVRRRWRKLLGQTGEFDAPEDSKRCRALTAAWERQRPEAEPIGHTLRDIYSDRWVRFHSLPESKRYAETPDEAAEILRRHRTVLSELAEGAAPHDVVVIAEDWGSRDYASGQSRRRVPGAWPWRRLASDEPDLGYHYLWAATGLNDEQLDDLLLAIANFEARAILAPADLKWLYWPYDGGADVILPDTPARDALRSRHEDWLSAHRGGL